VTENEEIRERYEAAESLHVWFRHLVAIDGTSSVLSSAASAVMNLYLESGQEVRDAIETGFLEHPLETNALLPYFEHWAHGARHVPITRRGSFKNFKNSCGEIRSNVALVETHCRRE
jgi:hypothetical protein